MELQSRHFQGPLTAGLRRLTGPVYCFLEPVGHHLRLTALSCHGISQEMAERGQRQNSLEQDLPKVKPLVSSSSIFLLFRQVLAIKGPLPPVNSFKQGQGQQKCAGAVCESCPNQWDQYGVCYFCMPSMASSPQQVKLAFQPKWTAQIGAKGTALIRSNAKMVLCQCLVSVEDLFSVPVILR